MDGYSRKHSKQLDISFNISDISDFKYRDLYKHSIINNIPYVVRKHIPRTLSDKIRNKLPENIQPLCDITLSEIKVVIPHYHNTDMCVLNWYLETGGEITSLYEGEKIVSQKLTSDNGNGFLEVDYTNLKVVESFVAKPGDVWLFDTTTIHSVSNPDFDDERRFTTYKDTPRMVLQMYFSAPYEYVSSFLPGINIT